jgi:hypothetical protein
LRLVLRQKRDLAVPDLHVDDPVHKGHPHSSLWSETNVEFPREVYVNHGLTGSGVQYDCSDLLIGGHSHPTNSQIGSRSGRPRFGRK